LGPFYSAKLIVDRRMPSASISRRYLIMSEDAQASAPRGFAGMHGRCAHVFIERPTRNTCLRDDGRCGFLRWRQQVWKTIICRSRSSYHVSLDNATPTTSMRPADNSSGRRLRLSGASPVPAGKPVHRDVSGCSPPSDPNYSLRIPGRSIGCPCKPCRALATRSVGFQLNSSC